MIFYVADLFLSFARFSRPYSPFSWRKNPLTIESFKLKDTVLLTRDYIIKISFFIMCRMLFAVGMPIAAVSSYE